MRHPVSLQLLAAYFTQLETQRASDLFSKLE
jgi:hypothetical protein